MYCLPKSVCDSSVCLINCSLHMLDLCVCMKDVLSEYNHMRFVISVLYLVSYVFW